MEYIIVFIATFLTVFLFYNIFVIRKEAALKKMKTGKEYSLFLRINSMKDTKMEFKRLIRLLSVGNATIVSIMGVIVTVLKQFITNFYIWIITSSIVAVILLIPLIMIVYKIIGKIVKKEGK